MKIFSMRYLILVLALLVLTTLAVSHAPIAHAAVPPLTIAVADGVVGVDGADGKCSLIEAIQNANANAATNADCTAGSGDDIITLAANSTYTLTAVNNTVTVDGTNGLPVIVSTAAGGKLTIEGSGSTITRSGATTFRFFDLAAASDLTLNQITVSNGSAAGVSGVTRQGGAFLVNLGAKLTLTNCTVSNNSATDDAGAIHILSAGTISTVNITNCTFSNNTAVDDGGAIVAGTSSSNAAALNITNSTFTNNTATGSGGEGGVINSFSANITITNSTFQNNSAVSRGGALFLQPPAAGSDSISNSTFTGNSTTADTNGGGAINYQSGTHTVTNSTISGNTSNNNGGGILVTSNGANVTLNFVTIANNTADNNSNGSGDGGGIATVAGTAAPTVNLKNSIIADNADKGTQAPNLAQVTGSTNGFNSLGYNHIESTATAPYTAAASDVTGTDPALTALANNGGTTQTQAPAIGSPVLDTIPNGTNGCGSTPGNTDQRGVARASDSNNDGTAACDKGAVEAGAGICGIQAASEPVDLTISPTLKISTTDDGTDLDCLRVTEIPTTHPNANANIVTNKYWQINTFKTDKVTTATADYTADLTLPYSAADNGDKVCRYTGTGTTWNCDKSSFVANTSITRTGISEFSDWSVENNVAPTSASLVMFQVKPGKSSVKVMWETGTESSVYGFNVWKKANAGKKAQNKQGKQKAQVWTQVNDAMIPAQYPGGIQGAGYTLTDDTIKAGKKYQYKLEIIHVDGSNEWSDVEVVKTKKQK